MAVLHFVVAAMLGQHRAQWMLGDALHSSTSFLAKYVDGVVCGCEVWVWGCSISLSRFSLSLSLYLSISLSLCFLPFLLSSPGI